MENNLGEKMNMMTSKIYCSFLSFRISKLFEPGIVDLFRLISEEKPNEKSFEAILQGLEEQYKKYANWHWRGPFFFQ